MDRFVINASQLTQHGDVWCIEASDIGLPPGRWPIGVAVHDDDLGVAYHFTLSKTSLSEGAEYMPVSVRLQQLQVKLVIFND